MSKAKEASKTFTDVIKGIMNGEGFSSPEELAEERVKICQSCPHYTGSTCTVCGCHIKTKAKLKKARCPKGYWKQKMIEKRMTGSISKDFDERCCK